MHVIWEGVNVREHGPETLARFNEPGLVIWYYRAVADALGPHTGRVPVAELRAATDELARLIGPAEQATAEVAS